MSNFHTISGWRLRHLIDVVDFDTIKNICDIGDLS